MLSTVAPTWLRQRFPFRYKHEAHGQVESDSMRANPKERIMALRYVYCAALGCVGGLLLGCGVDDKDLPAEADAFGPLESYRAGVGFDPAGRNFLRYDTPVMATMLHEETVVEFISQPGNGGGRLLRFTPRAPSDWVELVPES